MHDDEPWFAYLPATQSVHDPTSDVVEYLPSVHRAQTLAPELVPVFVIEPARQSAQSLALLEPAVPLYLPAAQSVH